MIFLFLCIPNMYTLGDPYFTQTVFETQQQYYSDADLLTFQSKYDLTIQAVNNIGGFETSSCGTGSINCQEGNLDVQYIMGIAQNIHTIYWYNGDNSDPFLAYITAIANQYNPPTVHSISWGSIEQEVAPSIKGQFNLEALKLSLMGVTVVVSSGDGTP